MSSLSDEGRPLMEALAPHCLRSADGESPDSEGEGETVGLGSVGARIARLTLEDVENDGDIELGGRESLEAQDAYIGKTPLQLNA